MTSEQQRPLSDFVAQGWEVVSFSTTAGGTDYAHTVLLRRQRQHKILTIWKKVFGGVDFKEMDV